MNFRPIIERPKPRDEQSEARFGRASAEPAPPRPDATNRNSAADVSRLLQLAERQVAQSNEMLQILAAVVNFLSRERDGGASKEQLDAIDSRLRRIEDLLSDNANGNAPPAAQPARTVAAAVRGEAVPVRETQVREVAQEFAPAFRELAARCGIGNADNAAAKIEAAANGQGLPWESRGDALLKAAFGLVSRVATNAAPAALTAFAQRLLGAGASLIQPKPGDAFDPAVHHDVSVEVTGTRSRVSYAVFPGVQVDGRVLVRALIHT